jgi:hypothetical protein
MAELWTAFDLTTLTANTTTGLVVGVGITLLFVAYGLIRKTGGAIKR